MGRGYSKKTITRLAESEQSTTGVRLIALCVDAKLNASEVAKYFGVSRMTLFNWSKGKAMHPLREKLAVKFIDKIKSDIEQGVLPFPSKEEQVAYLQSMQVE